MVFTQDNDSIEDGFLHTFEIYNMNLNADMAVLSACNTGYGKLIKGAGIMSLARGFSYAGVPSVVMSHWQVDDKSTSELMNVFYQNIADGMTKSSALRNAKLTFIKQANAHTSHPFYWAGFVLIGDDSPIITKSHNSIIFLMVGLVTLLIIILSAFRFYKKKRVR